MIFNQCEHCGANLDPCERCDCMEDIKSIENEKHSAGSEASAKCLHTII